MKVTLNDFGITMYELLDGGTRWRSDPNFLPPNEIERTQAPLPESLLHAIDEALDRRKKEQHDHRDRMIYHPYYPCDPCCGTRGL